MLRSLFAPTVLACAFALTQRPSALDRPFTPAPHVHHVAWKHTQVLVTAYVVGSDRSCTSSSARTATGTKPTLGTVAVDPAVFHLGRTIFRIPGYGYGIARDTGAYIHGRHIDVVLHSCAHARRWGARTLVIAYATVK